MVSALSFSSIESHMYAVFFVSPSSFSSEESHTYSVSPDSSSFCSSRGVLVLIASCVFASCVLVLLGKEGGHCYRWESMYSHLCLHHS